MKSTVWSSAVILLGSALVFSACQKGPAGPAGSSYTPPAPLCSSPVVYGFSAATIYSSLYSSGVIRCSPITLATAGTAIRLSVHVADTAPAGQVRMGIYTDAAAYPGRLVAQTVPANMTASSWNTINLPYDMYLPAGTYWLAYLMSDNNEISANSAGAAGSKVYVVYSWSSLPETFPGGGTSNEFTTSIVAGICP